MTLNIWSQWEPNMFYKTYIRFYNKSLHPKYPYRYDIVFENEHGTCSTYMFDSAFTNKANAKLPGNKNLIKGSQDKNFKKKWYKFSSQKLFRN